jgi:hypothetical protein
VALLVVVLVAVRVVAVVAVLRSGQEEEFSILGGDARRYEAIVDEPGRPYRDFDVEYPPLTLGLVHLVDRPTTLGTLTVLAVSQLLLELATAVVLAWAWSRRAAVAYLVLASPMLVYPFAYLRTDLLSVFLAVLGLGLLRRGLDRRGGAALALSVFAKVWPLVLAPSMVVRRRGQGLVAWAITGAVALGAWVAWAGPDGIRQILTFRGATGWQIESIPGIVLHGLDPAGSTVQQGAWRTATTAPDAVRAALSLAALTVVAVAWWLAHRVPTPAHHLATPGGREMEPGDAAVEGYAPLAAVTAVLVLSSIISPQYVLWFLPFAAIVTVRGDRTVAALTLAAGLSSTLGLLWIEELIAGDGLAVATVAVRNVTLVALLAVALVRLVRLGARPCGPVGTDRAVSADQPTATGA